MEGGRSWARRAAGGRQIRRPAGRGEPRGIPGGGRCGPRGSGGPDRPGAGAAAASRCDGPPQRALQPRGGGAARRRHRRRRRPACGLAGALAVGCLRGMRNAVLGAACRCARARRGVVARRPARRPLRPDPPAGAGRRRRRRSPGPARRRSDPSGHRSAACRPRPGGHHLALVREPVQLHGRNRRDQRPVEGASLGLGAFLLALLGAVPRRGWGRSAWGSPGFRSASCSGTGTPARRSFSATSAACRSATWPAGSCWRWRRRAHGRRRCCCPPTIWQTRRWTLCRPPAARPPRLAGPSRARLPAHRGGGLEPRARGRPDRRPTISSWWGSRWHRSRAPPPAARRSRRGRFWSPPCCGIFTRAARAPCGTPD